MIGRVKYDLYRNAHVGGLFTDREFMATTAGWSAFDTALPFGGTTEYRLPVLQVGPGRKRRPQERLGHGGHRPAERPQSHLGRGHAPGCRRNSPVSSASSAGSTPSRIATTSSYRWWPETWIRNWGPGFNIGWLHDYDKVLQNSTDWNPSVSFTFAKNITLNTSVARTMERYRDIDFYKTNWSISSNVNTSRKVLFSANLQQRRRDPVHRQPVSRTADGLRHHGDVPAVLAPAVGAQAGRKPVPRSGEPARRSST